MIDVQEGLLKLGMVHGTSERAKVTELQGTARRLESLVTNELQGVMALSDRLATLKKGLARAARDQDRASAVLDQCSACLDMEYGDVRQALVNSKVSLILILNEPILFFVLQLLISS